MEKSTKPLVLVSEKVYQKIRDILNTLNHIQFESARANEQELSDLIKEKNPIGVVIGTETYTGPLYDALKEGALIARFGVGCDGVDFPKAKARGLIVTNTPEVLETTVAELTVFLAAELMRKVGASSQQLKNGVWAPQMGRDLHAKVWAIIGMGKIGMRLSQILSRGFGVRVLGCKRNLDDMENLKKEYGVESASPDFNEVVRTADVVSIHIPANKDTFHYLDKNRLSLLKRGAILINTGRGSLVDENALYDLLETGQLGGAALDVFESEPYVPQDPEKDLRTLANVVMTPHIGSNTEECAVRMAKRVIRNVEYFLQGRLAEMDLKES